MFGILIVVNTISYHRVIGLANLRNLNTVEEKKSQEDVPSSADQDSSKKVTEEINKLNNEIAQLTEKNNEILVRYCFSQPFCKCSVFI